MFLKHENVVMGRGCEISDYASLENVTLGDRVCIGDGVQLKNVVVGSGTKLGVNVRLYSPDHLRPVEVGANNWFSYGVFGEATGGQIITGEGVTLAHEVKLLTSSGPGKNNVVMNELYPEERGGIDIGSFSWICAQSVILPGTTFLSGAIVAALSMVPGNRTYGAWSLYAGTPARFIKNLDQEKVKAAKRKHGIMS